MNSLPKPVERSCAVRVERFGPPLEVATLGEVPRRRPAQGEVLLEMEFSPVNPADLNVLEGAYGLLPELPFTPGVEGVGRVVDAGCPSGAALMGTRVLLPVGWGAWRRYGCAEVEDLLALPEKIAPEQAAMLRINPATALCLLETFLRLAPGEWIVQNAANSGVGRAVIQIARILGVRTLNVVRRPELVRELRQAGADLVVEEGEGLAKRIQTALAGTAVRLALNAVGGESATELAKVLAPEGVLVTYGAMARKPLRIPNSLLIFKDLRVRGFWVSRWYRKAGAAASRALLERVAGWAAGGLLHTPVEAKYPLSQIRPALEHALREGRSGKVLLHP